MPFSEHIPLSRSSSLSLSSCMNLRKRLQPAKRAWKNFTAALHTKLCRLSASKSIKKSKARIETTTKTSSTTVVRPRINHRRKKIQKTPNLCRYKVPKRSAPVYIDELFNETVVTSNTLVKEKCSTSSASAKLANPYALVGTGTGEKVMGGEIGTSGADDLWESLQLASPLMHGINERADEFIARIKAEMHLHETMTRRL